jgi:hypothetical protein
MMRARKKSDQEMMERLMAIFEPNTTLQAVRSQNNQEGDDEQEADEEDDNE